MSKSHKFIVALFGIIMAAAVAEKLASPLILAWALKPSANTTPDTFGTAVDTNHWFKVNDRAYYVLVRTNVWPIEPLTGQIVQSSPSNSYDMGFLGKQWPDTIYFRQWRISNIPISTNSIIIENLNHPGLGVSIHDLNVEGTK